jgi:hypothetical protein
MLGTAVFAGMLGVTLFGIFLTPVFFYVIQWVNDWRSQRRPQAPEDYEEDWEEPEPAQQPRPDGDGPGITPEPRH